jgi:hypothetical protein
VIPFGYFCGKSGIILNEKGLFRVAYAAYQIALLTLLLSGALAFYFFPSLFAYRTGRKNATAIFVVNFFFGVTAVGWIFALIWAFRGKRRREAVKETEEKVTQRLRGIVKELGEKA